jgi:uncharacterized protein YecT (DUF1311 family)
MKDHASKDHASPPHSIRLNSNRWFSSWWWSIPLCCALLLATPPWTSAAAATQADAPTQGRSPAIAAGVLTLGPVQSDPLSECWAAVGDQPRTALAACLQARQADADDRMNRAYKTVENDLSNIDSAGKPQALRSLRASQDAFLQFRNAECQRQGDAAMGGSGADDLLSACTITLTRWRAQALLRQ